MIHGEIIWLKQKKSKKMNQEQRNEICSHDYENL